MLETSQSDSPPPVTTDRLAVVERVVAVGLFLAMTIVGCVQILNRHGLNLPVSNLEQLLGSAWAFRARSGTMEFSRNLSGPIVTPSGRTVVIGLTIHDPVQLERPDKRFNPLIGGLSGAAADWLGRARAFEVGVARGFIGAIA